MWSDQPKRQRKCGASLDKALLHPFSCVIGGGPRATHEAVNDALTSIARDVYGPSCASSYTPDIEASLGNRPTRGDRSWIVPDGLIRTYPRLYCDVTINPYPSPPRPRLPRLRHS